MKCTRCLALTAANDTVCFSCGAPIQEPAPLTPSWAYLFATLCGIIPIISLGGVIPVILGVGGARSCLGVARSHFLPGFLRVAACVGITAGSWVLFAIMIGVITEITR